jgi:quinol monooxygenase YgiN
MWSPIRIEKRVRAMIVTVTEGRPNEEQHAQTEVVLAEFLPRMKQEPGVVEILHYADPESGAAVTMVVWEGEADVRRYREGELIKEAIAFEQQSGESARRAGPFSVRRYV